jgi:hypothetical protein
MNQAKHTSEQAHQTCVGELGLSTEIADFITNLHEGALTEGAYVYDDGRVGLGMGWEHDYQTLAALMGKPVTSPTEVDETWDDVDAVFDLFFRE